MQWRVGYVVLSVADLKRSVDFYENTLGMPAARVSEDGFWAEIQTEGATLALWQPKNEPSFRQPPVGGATGVCFVVGDAAGVYEDLKSKGVSFPVPPKQQDWGGIEGDFEDPDGNRLTIVQLPK